MNKTPRDPSGDPRSTGSHTDLQLDTYEIEFKKGVNWSAILIIVVLICGLGALGTYTWHSHNELKRAKAGVKKSNADLAACKEKNRTTSGLVDAAQKKYEEALQSASDLRSRLESTGEDLARLRDEQLEAQKELAQLKRFTKRFDKMISAGKLEITFRRGRMVVNLPAEVLFASGSADLSEEGQKALSQVAKILRKVKDKRFVVAGHTDNVKIAKSNFESNWELSTARAVVVTRELIKSGLSASRLTASGFSQYDPIASNSSEAGRQKNRRIEIIIEPYLKDIPTPKKESKKYKKDKDIPASNGEPKKYKITKVKS